MVSASSLTPRSSTVWLSIGIASFEQAADRVLEILGDLARVIEVRVDADFLVQLAAATRDSR
jgi:hypothetical protein